MLGANALLGGEVDGFLHLTAPDLGLQAHLGLARGLKAVGKLPKGKAQRLQSADDVADVVEVPFWSRDDHLAGKGMIGPVPTELD